MQYGVRLRASLCKQPSTAACTVRLPCVLALCVDCPTLPSPYIQGILHASALGLCDNSATVPSQESHCTLPCYTLVHFIPNSCRMSVTNDLPGRGALRRPTSPPGRAASMRCRRCCARAPTLMRETPTAPRRCTMQPAAPPVRAACMPCSRPVQTLGL